MVAGGKHHGLVPHSIFIPLHGVLSRTPIVEISHQEDLLGLFRIQYKRPSSSFNFFFDLIFDIKSLLLESGDRMKMFFITLSFRL
jgi:hypothetical protein